MDRWTLVAEYLAFVILVILFLRYYLYERHVAYTFNRKYHLVCLCMSTLSVLINVVCVYTIAYAWKIPLWLNLLLNSLYFEISLVMCSMLAHYLFMQLFEHVYDKRPLKRAWKGIAALTVGFTAAVIWNLRSGVMFYFDADRVYRRGPLNRLGYAILFIEICMLVVCFLKYRHSVCKNMANLIYSLPPLILSMAAFQVAFPEILLNGTLTAIANLIIVISFNSRTLDHDCLTGIRNRNNFFTEVALRLANRQAMHFILLHLENYAAVNQMYGHPFGDAFLYEIAHKLEQITPQGRVFRYSNVTFAMVMPFKNDEAARQTEKEVLDCFDGNWTVGERQAHVLSTQAYMVYHGEDWTPEQISEYLEYTLALARRQEKRELRFDQDIGKMICHKHHMLRIMRDAIENRRFRVWYQPLYSCHTHTFCGAEALLRLNDDEGNPVSPDLFIALAEENGMIDALSRIVVEEVCRFLSSPAGRRAGQVAINLSRQSFQDPEVTEYLLECLHRYGLAPERIKVEITESTILSDMSHARRQMQRLSELGIKIYMDDFGVGYSNFAYVLDSPIQCVKIDRSLARAMLQDPGRAQILRMLIELFHQIGKTLVVEGIEHEEQARRVIEYGADMIQGYYYARPMPEDEFCRFLENHPWQEQ